jgi:hypothetical protein
VDPRARGRRLRGSGGRGPRHRLAGGRREGEGDRRPLALDARRRRGARARMPTWTSPSTINMASTCVSSISPCTRREAPLGATIQSVRSSAPGAQEIDGALSAARLRRRRDREPHGRGDGRGLRAHAPSSASSLLRIVPHAYTEPLRDERGASPSPPEKRGTPTGSRRSSSPAGSTTTRSGSSSAPTSTGTRPSRGRALALHRAAAVAPLLDAAQSYLGKRSGARVSARGADPLVAAART